MKKGRYNRKKEIELARKYVDEVMQTKYSSIEQEIGKLSGGNQQKVIISRWLLVTEKILILDEPTRGIDVKTKSDIYHLIDDLTATGLSIHIFGDAGADQHVRSYCGNESGTHHRNIEQK